MKVLHIVSGDLWAGAEVQAFTLLTTLQKMAKIEVAVALMNDGELAKRLRDRNISVFLFPENKLNGLQILFGMRKLMLGWRPDVVHTHRIKENVLGSIANKLAGNALAVRTTHGDQEHPAQGIGQLPQRILQWLDLQCGLHLQQCVVSVSKDLAEKLARQYPRNKIAVIENGVDVDAVRSQIHPVEFRTREPNAIHIGIVGRLAPVKRVDIFLEMAALLRTNNSDRIWRFHIFGDGPLHASLVAQAQQLGIADICHFHSHRNDIIACIAGLDALVMCSDHEGLPMTILESLAVGSPIVAHAVGGLIEVLQHRTNRALVEEHTPSKYAEALISLITTHKFAEHRGNTSKNFGNFDAKVNAGNLLALYLKLQRHTPAGIA